MTAIAWIRRSMREYDNTAILKASEEHERVIPFYVIDKEYFKTATLGYPRVKFWRDSLVELEETLNEKGKKLVIRKGKPVKELEKIVEEVGADAVYYNNDYSPYARKRDSKAEKKIDAEVKGVKDLTMFEKEEILTNSGDPYKVFSYYWKKWDRRDKRKPREPGEYSVPDLDSGKIPSLEKLGFERPEGMKVWKGGRKAGRERLESFKDRIWNYKDKRDYPSRNGTSKLSADLKFGTLSIRELFWEVERIKARNPNSDTSGLKEFQRQLCWRDFYFQVLWNYPYSVEKPFLEKYESIEWRSKDEAGEDWKRFKKGKTGFPFVDAGMRQLKRKGWMHNRLRMLVTSFACKDLWLDWKDLHEYFKEMFVDAEISAMVGGIQWAYSIGTDAQPYFRVFNPWKHGEEYDPDGTYIREYVPELSEVPDQYIHRPYKMPKTVQLDSGCVIGEDYPEPMVDHDDRRKKAIERFEKASES